MTTWQDGRRDSLSLRESSDFWHEAWWSPRTIGRQVCIYRHRLSWWWSWRGFEFGSGFAHVIEEKRLSQTRADVEVRAAAWVIDAPCAEQDMKGMMPLG